MEDELHRDAWKWENCLHGAVSFLGKSLRNPVFDIHYNARLAGRDHGSCGKYASVLEPLNPVIEIPITT
jgi:hypothetical protein